MTSSAIRHLCVLGLQWGDEGKGKIVDVLTGRFDGVVRYQGGANAGHTICVGDETTVLHHLPSGILRDGVEAVLGNGMVIDPVVFLKEVQQLSSGARSRIHVSDRAHLVLPHHKSLDSSREAAHEKMIGTTKRGIGPAYEDKAARRGVRIGDLYLPKFAFSEVAERMTAVGLDETEISTYQETFEEFREVVRELVCDTATLLRDYDERGMRMLFEGAQGCLLDLDFGTYPYVTSSSPSFLGLGCGSGFSPRRIDHVLGVTKAYSTRVGEGPFPSEIFGEEAEALREAGGEFGSTTGRPRRIGWLDLPALRYAIQINDVDTLALTKIDVLRGRETVPVVTGYRVDGKLIEHFPASVPELGRVEPVLEDWPGWSTDELPALEPFIGRLEEAIARRVSVVSTGRGREDVHLSAPFAEEGS